VEVLKLGTHQTTGNALEKKNRFWRRQFAAEVTTPQIVFDMVFGVMGPILCFVFDPFVFHSGFVGPPLLPEYQAFTYLFSGLQMALLCLWLLIGPGNSIWNWTIGGALVGGGIFCLAAGCVLAPFSVMGLMFVIGIFGFTPFLTALVYLRNAMRAFRARSHDEPHFMRALGLTVGLAFALALPALSSMQIHQTVKSAVNEIVHGDPQHAALAAHRLVPLRFFAGVELDQMANAYLSETDPTRKELLKSCYREITGEDIENRAHILQD